ncbi:uncharacterized protein LOC127528370 isoform X1 [Erpetoichthys calabaricus]|uniref:uncharacterized protein LOC127528370 isoform X1 n=1 Tax=Erpetoichthys calabaricus TaxID=27687 RepID=UPI002233EE84|nr:uncharacterized protein LOC127528370 isoform X1 [Erpetoichthys calabaricus]
MDSATTKPTTKAETDVIILEDYQSIEPEPEPEKSKQEMPKRETRQSVKNTEAPAGGSTTFDEKKTDTPDIDGTTFDMIACGEPKYYAKEVLSAALKGLIDKKKDDLKPDVKKLICDIESLAERMPGLVEIQDSAARTRKTRSQPSVTRNTTYRRISPYIISARKRLIMTIIGHSVVCAYVFSSVEHLGEKCAECQENKCIPDGHICNILFAKPFIAYKHSLFMLHRARKDRLVSCVCALLKMCNLPCFRKAVKNDVDDIIAEFEQGEIPIDAYAQLIQPVKTSFMWSALFQTEKIGLHNLVKYKYIKHVLA